MLSGKDSPAPESERPVEDPVSAGGSCSDVEEVSSGAKYEPEIVVVVGKSRAALGPTGTAIGMKNAKERVQAKEGNTTTEAVIEVGFGSFTGFGSLTAVEYSRASFGCACILHFSSPHKHSWRLCHFHPRNYCSAIRLLSSKSRSGKYMSFVSH